MARLLYGVSPADYVIDAATGLPKSGVVLNVYVSIGGSQITDLLGTTGVTYTAGSALTQVTSNAAGMYPFYGPDGENGTLALRDAAGAGAWYMVDPSSEGDIVQVLAGQVATLATAVAGFTAPSSISADAIIDGTTNHAFTAVDDTKLTAIEAGATANSSDTFLRSRTNHTGSQITSTITGLDTALAAKVVNVAGFGRVWGRTTLQGFPTGADGAVDGDWLFMDAT